MDSLNLTQHSGTASSDSFTYTVPSGGSNKLLLVIVRQNDYDLPTATQNGVSLATFTQFNGTSGQGGWFYSYLATPTSGTFQITFTGTRVYDLVVMTLQDAAQTSPIDTSAVTTTSGVSTKTTSTTTTQGNDLLISMGAHVGGAFTSYGTNETQITNYGVTNFGDYIGGSWKTAASSSGSESTTGNASGSGWFDWALLAVKSAQATSHTSQYLAKVDDGSFNSYSFASTTNTWTVYDKKGTKYTYGSSDSGRMYDTSTGTSTPTYRWMLQEVRDTNGNYITYTYNRDNNVLYPFKITYTGNGSTDGTSTVTFATSTRADMRVSYASGFAATTTKVISQITAAVNGATVRQYDLTYSTGHNGYRSLLSAVQQKGYDENNNLTTLPATTFGYVSSTTQYYAPGVRTIESSAYAVADTNGDAINDINVFSGGAGNGNLFLGGGINAISVPSASLPPPEYWADIVTVYSPLERGVRYIDINGDGKADAIRGWVDDQAGNSDFAIYTNQYATSTNSYSWTATSTNYTGSIPTFAKRTSAGLILTGGLFGDVNGDGLPDYVTSLPGTFATTTYLGNGSAFDATTTVFAAAKSFPTTVPTETASQLVDINGDGLDDWVYSSSTNMYVLLNNGTGWTTTPDPRWTFATSTLYLGTTSPTTYYDRGIRFMDLNGDGLPDLVRAYKNTTGCSGEAADVKAVYLNTGSGWATSTAYTLPAYIASCSAGAMVFNEYANFNGNGQLQQDILSTVRNPRGGVTSVVYKPSASVTDNPGAAVSVLVASKIGTDDGRGNYATTSYAYTGGVWYSTSTRDRRFAGFSPVTVTNPDSITTTHFVQDAIAKMGRPFRKEVSDLSGNLKQRTLYRWDTVAHGDSTFVGLGRQVVQDFGSDGSHRDKATDYQYSSTTNDLLKTIEYGEVTSGTDTAFTDITGDTRTTNISYVASSSVNMSLPIQKTVLNNNSATSSDQRFYYDSLAFGEVSLGNLTKQEDWISGTTYASSTKTYNSYGLVATSTDRNGNATSYVYDAYNLFTATTTNALLQKTHAYFNYSNGKVKRSIDPNNRLSQSLYDGLGRVTEVAQSDTSSPTSYATTSAFTYTNGLAVHRTDYLNSATTTEAHEYYDGLGRLIQTRKSSPTAGIYSVTDRVYDVMGRLASTSLPYFSSGSASTSPSTNSALYTNYTYDPLQRVTRISNAVGDTTNTYYQWKTSTVDPNSHLKDLIVDAFGNLVTVVEYNSSAASTTYAYDSLNNLATTTDASGNVRGFVYDGLGRRVSAQDLHATSDSTFGIWSYSYDHQGNLISQIDPKSQVVNRTYDALNRMLTEDYTGGTGTEVTLTYDSCTNGIGYLCVASSTSARTTNSYDILGRISVATTTIQNVSYAMSYAYDRQGNMTTATYPNGSRTQYAYNTAGLTNRIERKPSGGSFSDIISNYDYAPHGQVQNVFFGNNASTTYSYDPSAIYRLTGLQTKSNGTDLQQFAYIYDAAGNITQIANTATSSIAAATSTYSYDALNRLVSAVMLSATSSPYSQYYSYDALGNMLSLSTALSSAPGSAPSILDTLPITLHQVTGATSDSFSYTVPSGSNKVLLVFVSKGGDKPSMSQNGVSIPANQIASNFNGSNCDGTHSAGEYFAWLAAPTSGTFSINWSVAGSAAYAVFTVDSAAQAYPIIDAATCRGILSTNHTISASVTATSSNTLLLSWSNMSTGGGGPSSHGAGQTEFINNSSGPSYIVYGSYVVGSSTTNTLQGMTESYTGSLNQNLDMQLVAVTPAAAGTGTTTSNVFTYAGDSNPHAVTQIANGVSSSTFAYDNNGNLTQKTSDGITTSYIYDYANRLTALGVAGQGTTTYAYSAFGERVLQTGTSTVWIYPSKFYSVASSTGSGAAYATTTEYVFSGDTLVSTTDQQLAGGVATGTPATRYIHPDHLGSTNVVTDEDGAVIETLDYFPYGSTRVSTGIGASARKYIGQFYDQNTNLNYFNARYYDANIGQFISHDPVFLAIGDANKLKQLTGLDQQTFLSDPQLANSTSYARGNPIRNKDPEGKFINIVAGAIIGDFVGVASQLYNDVSTGRSSSVTEYIAAGLGGAANGAVIASGGYWYGPVGGLVGGGVQSAVSQTGSITNGSRNNFSFGEVVGSGLSQAPFGLIPGLRVPGITAGRNNFEAIGKNVFTRYDNGSINSISMSTAGKVFVGNQVQNAPQNAAQAYMSVPANTQSLITGLSNLVSALQSFARSLSASSNKK
ncbi:hypothetical protein LMTR13_03350 [Bradyrhizobium icense]|uniref:Teneurin-like YD-shell domain-containing protein n=2 Tax=Bradyrhizobium icense TaxID=1274631 RepID=A0A1B1U9A0_9BRAD|nr:hypothetical protein LMTR13_03350 [Bradyrhizobium icense]